MDICPARSHRQRGLTPRSSGAPTVCHAGHQALGLRPILRLLSSAPSRCRPLSSNVRPQTKASHGPNFSRPRRAVVLHDQPSQRTVEHRKHFFLARPFCSGWALRRARNRDNAVHSVSFRAVERRSSIWLEDVGTDSQEAGICSRGTHLATGAEDLGRSRARHQAQNNIRRAHCNHRSLARTEGRLHLPHLDNYQRRSERNMGPQGVSGGSGRKDLPAASALRPNPSFKPSPNSVARRPSSAGPAAHFALAVQRATLSVPA